MNVLLYTDQYFSEAEPDGWYSEFTDREAALEELCKHWLCGNCQKAVRDGIDPMETACASAFYIVKAGGPDDPRVSEIATGEE